MIRNQDIELNKRIVRGGGHICLIPDTYSTYLARETFKGIARNNYMNGKWNILTVFYTKQFSSLSIRHFIPFIVFIISFFAGTVIFFLFTAYCNYFFIFDFLYLVCFHRLFIFKYKEETQSLLLLIAFPVLHLSYGWGSFVGLDGLRKIK